eukprot:CAMPEP_0183586882 /NCGR_PEP_ID=MMETSP0371-20130417/157944_1 /TAXON_ID=268820 /ORGANISM="Peridinium aciculiferum, Strain PAER-2" /LENGTH=124 /DNA_ID=CAMNT_0025798015 /DNA_START=65 /DNA_END=436 /DNA_ORIENTATION=+
MPQTSTEHGSKYRNDSPLQTADKLVHSHPESAFGHHVERPVCSNGASLMIETASQLGMAMAIIDLSALYWPGISSSPPRRSIQGLPGVYTLHVLADCILRAQDEVLEVYPRIREHVRHLFVKDW